MERIISFERPGSGASDGPSLVAVLTERMTSSVVFRHLSHSNPTNSFMGVDVLYHSLVNQQHLRTTAHVGMNRERKDGVVVLTVHPVKLISPHLLDVARTDPTVTVRCLLDEHHRRKIVHVPV